MKTKELIKLLQALPLEAQEYEIITGDEIIYEKVTEIEIGTIKIPLPDNEIDSIDPLYRRLATKEALVVIIQ